MTTIKEETDATMTAPIVDKDDVALPLVDLTTLVFTLEDLDTGTIINNRYKQNVKNANDGTVSSTSVLTMLLKPVDHIIIDDTKLYEVHRWLLEWTWNSGGVTKANKAYGDYQVENLRQVPA